MHKIFLDAGQVSMLTNQIDVSEHKHWMLQLFFCPNRRLDLRVNGEAVNGTCILVGADAVHRFTTGDILHYSMLIEATSDMALQMKKQYLQENPFANLSEIVTEELVEAFQEFALAPELNIYHQFIQKLYEALHMKESMKHNYDERICKLFKLLNQVEYGTGDFLEDGKQKMELGMCVSELAKALCLSSSRLAHLFKEETGIPLKSYLVLQKIYDAFYYLLKGDSITDAAMKAGFDSPSHFAATTKSMMGTSARIAIKDSDFLKVSPLNLC